MTKLPCCGLLPLLSGSMLVCGSMLFCNSTAVAAPVDLASTDENYSDLWLRLDIDRVAANAWLGGTWSLDAVDVAYDLIVTQAFTGAVDTLDLLTENYRSPSVRAELGPELDFGALFLLPKVGLGYDFERRGISPLVPQLIGLLQAGPLYFESWLQFYFRDLFDAGAQDSFYTRNFLLLALNNRLAFGPQFELTVALKNAPGKSLRSLPVGGRLNLAFMPELTLGLFLGYETQESGRNSEQDSVTGRITVVYLW
jgi:hypothetical protein